MSDQEGPNLMAKLFDIRIIAALLGIYGSRWSLPAPAEAGSSDPTGGSQTTELAVGGGNHWVGAALLVVAAGFAVWTVLRPKTRDEVGAEVDADDPL